MIAPLLPNKPRGVARVDDRRVLNGIFYVLRTGRRGAICRSAMGPTRRSTTATIAGPSGRLAGFSRRLAKRSPESLHLIDSSIVRAHQHAAGGKKGGRITPSAVLVAD